ncbi:hypothetical protein V6Z11_A07G143700 [Gossypium hirsutum]
MNQAQHIELSLDRQTTYQIVPKRLRLKTTSYDEKVEDVLKSAPHNSSYTSTIQKDILQIYTSRVRNVICEEIGDRKFSIIVDEARDESRKKKMAIVLRFVDKRRLCGEFNGLQALVLNDCRYAYYIHYFAHCLQLGLVAAYREVVEVHQFFKDLSNIFSISSTFSKQHNELQKSQASEITCLVSINELATGTRMNQIDTLQHPDILNAMSLVSTTKDLIQKLRDDGWNELLKNMISFCETWELNFSDMNSQYIVGHSRNNKEDIIVEHHYRENIFFATIDTQLQELKRKFNKNVVELLTLTTTLDPNEFFKLFDIEKIFILVNKFYPKDFSLQEKERLPYELKHYELDVCKHPNLKKISTLSELCINLVESGKSIMYLFVDRLILIILTLPFSTASLKCAFFAMKIVKTRLHSKMEDDFLRSYLVVYIEKENCKKI